MTAREKIPVSDFFCVFLQIGTFSIIDRAGIAPPITLVNLRRS